MKTFNIKKKFLFTFFFIFLLFFLIEISLRILKIEYPIFQQHDPIRGFSLLPNASGTWRREGEGFVRINSDGLRDIEHNIKKKENTLRIAILGDSFAEARSIDITDTFWFKLKKNLNNCNNFHNNKTIEIINFGVSEYGTTQQYLTLKNNVWKYNPDLVLLAFYSENDVADNYRELSKKKYRPYFLFQNGEKFKIDTGFLDSKPYKILSSYYGQLFIKISQYSRISQLIREAYVQSYFKKKQKESNRDNNKLTLVSSSLYNPTNQLWKNAWNVTEKIIIMIDKEVKKRNKDFILVSLSNPIQVNPDLDKYLNFKEKNKIFNIFYPETRLKKLSKKNSFDYISLSKKMRKKALKENIYFHGFNNTKLGTGHWNIQGHSTASKIIASEICKLY